MTARSRTAIAERLNLFIAMPSLFRPLARSPLVQQMSAERHHLVANREALFNQRRLLSEPCKRHRTERDGRRALVDKPDPEVAPLSAIAPRGTATIFAKLSSESDRHGCAQRRVSGCAFRT